MSGKKKQTKDKLPNEEGGSAPPAVRPETDWLVSPAPIVAGNDVSPAFSRARHVASGRPFGSLVANVWQRKRAAWMAEPVPGDDCGYTRQEAYARWGADVATRLPSPLQAPHHTLSVAVALPALSAGDGDSGSGAVAIAAVIRRLVVAHTRLLNASCSTSLGYAPVADVEGVLGCAVHHTGGYRGPEPEQPSKAFDPAHSPVAAAGRQRRLVRHPDATHVVVCRGAFYYQLTVADRATGAVVDVRRLAAGLTAIHSHATATAAVLDSLPISDADRAELRETQALLARLSCVHDDVSADVHRRLREVSAVNAYSLSQLEGGLFTIVLGDEAGPTSGVGHHPACTTGGGAQWLYSGLSLYVPWGVSGGASAAATAGTLTVTARVHAQVASLEPVQRLLLYAFSDANAAPDAAPPPAMAGLLTKHSNLLATMRHVTPAAAAAAERPASAPRHAAEAGGRASGPAADAEPGAAADGSGGGHHMGSGTGLRPAEVDRCTTILEDGLAAHLELWLPHSHRTPLLPAALPRYTPVWRPLAVPPAATALADVCLSLLLGACSGHGCTDGDTPVVAVSLLLPDSIGPVTQPLQSEEIAQYVRVYDSKSVLVTPVVRREARRSARDRVAALLQSCWSRGCAGSASPTGTPSAPVDVNIAIAVTARATVKTAEAPGSQARLLSCSTETGVPAAVHVRCHAVQRRAEKSLTLAECEVMGDLAVGASTPASEEAAGLLVSRTTTAWPSSHTCT